MRILPVLGIVMVLLACSSPTAPGPGATAKFRTVPDGVPDLWIVILDPQAAGPLGPLSHARALATDLTALYGGTVQSVYDYVLNGFSLQAPESIAVKISQDPRVSSVQQAQVARLADTQSTHGTRFLDRFDALMDRRDLLLQANPYSAFVSSA